MPLHIEDEAATSAVRRLAEGRKITLTDAVRIACEEALARDATARPIAARLADIHARLRQAASTGKKADKAFFDQAWEE